MRKLRSRCIRCSILVCRNIVYFMGVQFSSVAQSCPTMTPWAVARQASLSITNSQSLLKPMSIALVIPSNYLILCRPLLFLPSIFSSIRVFSKESVLRIRWPKYWSFNMSRASPELPSGPHSVPRGWNGGGTQVSLFLDTPP